MPASLTWLNLQCPISFSNHLREYSWTKCSNRNISIIYLYIYIYYVFIIYYIYLYYIHINDKPTGENHLKMSPGWTSRWQRKHQKASRETKGWNWKCDSWTGSATAWNMYHDLKTWKKIFQANGNDMRKCEKHFEDFKALWKTTRKDLGKCSIKMK